MNAICAHMGLNVAGLTVVLTSRPSLLQENAGLSAAAAANLMAVLSSGSATLEFLLNPIAGKASDTFGRKPFLVQAPAVSAALKLLVFLRPSRVTLALERCVSGACTTIGGSTTCSSALADLIKDPAELGRAYAQLGVTTGLGVILGPLLGGLAVGRSGDGRRAYLIGSLLAAGQFALISSTVKETLPAEQRKPLKPNAALLAAMNPLSFLSLYTRGPVLAKLVSIQALQCFCEGKSLSDMNGYYLLNEAKFNVSRRTLYITCFGVVMTLAGVIGRRTIAQLGMRRHTTLENVASAVGFCLTGSTLSPVGLFGALPIYAFAMERSAAIRSLAVNAAADAGMGKGEFSAAFANLRALSVAAAPLLFARAYASGIAAAPKSPGRGYFVAAAIALTAEAIHLSIGADQVRK